MIHHATITAVSVATPAEVEDLREFFEERAVSPPKNGADLDRVLERTGLARSAQPAHVFYDVMDLLEAAERADVFIYLQDGVPRCTGSWR
ncbi:MAG: hypothetical protein ACREXW_00820 [Gammaproteobacteria bacterium]